MTHTSASDHLPVVWKSCEWSVSTNSLSRGLHLQINAVTNLSQIGTISHYLKFSITSETNLETI